MTAQLKVEQQHLILTLLECREGQLEPAAFDQTLGYFGLSHLYRDSDYGTVVNRDGMYSYLPDEFETVW